MSQGPAPAVLTQADIEAEIQRLADLLEAETLRLPEVARRVAHAEVAHKVAYARAFLGCDGAMDLRAQVATAATEAELLARRLAEAEYEALVESLRSIRARLDACRTMAANVRAQT